MDGRRRRKSCEMLLAKCHSSDPPASLLRDFLKHACKIANKAHAASDLTHKLEDFALVKTRQKKRNKSWSRLCILYKKWLPTPTVLGCRLLAVFNLPPPQFAKKAGESVRRERRGERQMCRSFVRWFAESEKWSGVFVRPSVRRGVVRLSIAESAFLT